MVSTHDLYYIVAVMVFCGTMAWFHSKEWRIDYYYLLMTLAVVFAIFWPVYVLLLILILMARHVVVFMIGLLVEVFG